MGEVFIIAIAIVLVGLLVILPLSAVFLEHQRNMAMLGAKKNETDDHLAEKVAALEQNLKAQQAQIRELKELLEVNILKMEDTSELQQRIRDES